MPEDTTGTTAVQPPKPVQLARAVWIGGAALGAIRSVVQLSDRRALLEQLRASTPNLTQSQLNSLASSGIAFGLLLLAGFLAVNIWLAARMVGGRRWARLVITVLAAVELVFGVIGLVGIASGAAATVPGVSYDRVQISFTVAALVIDAVTLVLLQRPESTAYFARMREPRPPQAGPTPGPPFL